MNIRDKIQGKLGQPKVLEEREIIVLHEIMMSEYGWINIWDFMEMPIPTFWNIVRCLQDRKEKEAKEYEKAKRRKK